MKDFGDWLVQMTEELQEGEETDLPENVDIDSDGLLSAKCCRCGEWFDLDIDLPDLAESDGVYIKYYCGKDPHCCP